MCGVFSDTPPLQRSSTPSIESHRYSRPLTGQQALSPAILGFLLRVMRAQKSPVIRFLPWLLLQANACGGPGLNDNVNIERCKTTGQGKPH